MLFELWRFIVKYAGVGKTSPPPPPCHGSVPSSSDHACVRIKLSPSAAHGRLGEKWALLPADVTGFPSLALAIALFGGPGICNASNQFRVDALFIGISAAASVGND